MTKVSQRSGIILLVLISFVLVQSCATAPKLPEPKPGLYVNEDYRFSVAYPENWTPQPLQPADLYRIANPNPVTLPVLTGGVADAQEGATLDPKGFTEGAKQAIPGTKRYKIYDQEDVTLNDGTPAKAFTYSWTWADGQTKLFSAALITIKEIETKDGDKQLKYFNTVVTMGPALPGGDITSEQMLEIVKSWKFY
jgi:hypothetical protein